MRRVLRHRVGGADHSVEAQAKLNHRLSMRELCEHKARGTLPHSPPETAEQLRKGRHLGVGSHSSDDPHLPRPRRYGRRQEAGPTRFAVVRLPTQPTGRNYHVRVPITWSHPSVLALARDSDPLEAVVSAARALVYRALERGWTGPPFDPLGLAELHNVDVYPGQGVFDAALTGTGRRPTIEYNPEQSPARIRYSVAHEIAHTLFPDFAQRIRHRSGPHQRPDDWQLELLCNLAAAELLMPAGNFPALDARDLTIDRVVELHREFGVSVEAAAFQVARTTSARCVAFTTASHRADGGYTIDYAVGSANVDAASYRGARLPDDSHAAECVAVGVTAKGEERWPADDLERRVEAIGVPPYPGERLPRVVGLRLLSRQRHERRGIRYLRGDATRPRGRGPRVVAHVVNNRTPRWGGGFAAAIRSRWPKVQQDFIGWSAGGLSLGSAHIVEAAADVWVASIVAQVGYGPSPRPRLRYEALERGLEQLSERALQLGASVHAPQLGAGQAGGNWSAIHRMLERVVLARDVSVTVYIPTGPDPLPPEAGASMDEPDQQIMPDA